MAAMPKTITLDGITWNLRYVGAERVSTTEVVFHFYVSQATEVSDDTELECWAEVDTEMEG